MIERNCINVCSITGPEHTIKLVDQLFNENFSMESFYPLSNKNDSIERLMTWGSEEDIELLTYIFCRFNDPLSIDIAFTTDIPNLLFLRKISSKYNLTIEHSFYDDTSEYVGFNKIVNGNLTEFDYEEDPKSDKYISLKKKYNFFTEEPIKTQRIISMQDILKLNNK